MLIVSLEFKSLNLNQFTLPKFLFLHLFFLLCMRVGAHVTVREQLMGVRPLHLDTGD